MLDLHQKLKKAIRDNKIIRFIEIAFNKIVQVFVRNQVKNKIADNKNLIKTQNLLEKLPYITIAIIRSV
jgi:hypothetical protein